MEEFFTDPQVEEIALDHIEAIQSLSEKESERVVKAYRRVRQDLRDRLDVLGSGTFTAQKTRGAMMQVDLALEKMASDVNDEMDSSSLNASTMGIENLIKEIEKWNKKFTGAVLPINMNVVAVATDVSEMLFNKREASLRAYNESIRSQMANAIADATIAQSTMSELVSNIGRFFLGEEWRIDRIVRTELHNVYNKGKIRGMTDLWGNGEGEIPDLKKTLFHPMDSRTGKDSIWLNKHNPIVPIDEPFVETSTGKRLEYMAPPNRPNDRAILIPFREEWKN